MISIVKSSIDSIKKGAREAAPHLYRRYVEYFRARLPPKVSSVLSDTRNPVTLNEEEFDLLQKHYKQWWPQYDFDTYSTGRRAYERALSFLELAPLREIGKNVLDIGCGDGMTGAALSIYGHQVTLLDYEDWRDSRALGQNFILADLGKPLALSDSSYDFIFSFNTFEHIPDPALALNEMVRILRPGGFVWVDFNPLYRSPLGLHAFSFRMPYPQFLFSEDIIKSKLSDLGLNDLGHDMEMTQPLNRWCPEQFRDLWNRSDCEIVEYSENTDFSHLDIVMKYPEAFQGRGLCLDDLTVAGIFVVLQKR
jgi:SAM-dependent methyltransferase